MTPARTQTGNVSIGESLANAGAKFVSISAVVVRADGTIEDLGVIAETKPQTEGLTHED